MYTHTITRRIKIHIKRKSTPADGGDSIQNGICSFYFKDLSAENAISGSYISCVGMASVSMKIVFNSKLPKKYLFRLPSLLLPFQINLCAFK